MELNREVTALDFQSNREWARDFFNILELDVESIFQRYDTDGSGMLDREELDRCMQDLNGGRSPRDDEMQWLLKIADRDDNTKISKSEFRMLLRFWHGYHYMPPEFKNAFTECAGDGNGHLGLNELQAFLTRVSGLCVSHHEAKDIMEQADVNKDGKLGLYEVSGAIGSWYISVGRKPTPAMSLAFAATNRSSGRCHLIINYLVAATLFPTVYFPLYGYFGSLGTDCELDINHLMLIDAILWSVLTIIVLMKCHWLQALNCCLPLPTAAKLVYQMSWLLIGLEVSVCMLLAIVEAIGLWGTAQVEESGRRERRACNKGVLTPIDIPLSLRKARVESYPSFLEFGHIWFLFNLEFNVVCLAFYYGYLCCRCYRIRQADRKLQEESQSMENHEGMVERDECAATSLLLAT